MKLVRAVELSWPMERRCLRQEGSSCAPLKREEQKTQKAKSLVEEEATLLQT